MKSIKGRKGVFYKEHPTRKNGVRKDRQFILRYTLGGTTYKAVFGWESAGFTELQAEKKVVQFRENYRTGKTPISVQQERDIDKQEKTAEEQRKALELRQKITFGEFFQTVYFPHAQQNKKAATSLSEKGYFENWLKPVLGKIPMKDIVPFNLEKVLKNLQSRERRPATIKYVFAIFRQIWNMARRKGYVQGDSPSKSEDVKLPKVNNKRERFLSQDEADLLLERLKEKSEHQYEIALLSLHTGMRAGEIHKLTGECLNFENSTIWIRDSKGDKSRHVFMTEPLKEILKERYAQYGKGPLFPGRQGKIIPEPSHTFSRLANELFNQGASDPLQRVTFHTLRHTFASWLVMAGTPLYTVQRLLGHSSITITERYSHLAPDYLKAAAGTIEDLIQKHQEAKQESEQAPQAVAAGSKVRKLSTYTPKKKE